MTPAVTVILNCYRQAKFVRAAVESVLAQSFQDFELLAIDNGSPDETTDILRSYAGNPQIRLVLHPENRSVSQRFNEGVGAARGEFVCFLYSDDLLLPNKLADQVAHFRRLPSSYGVVYAPLQCLNETSGRIWELPTLPIDGDPLRFLLRSNDRMHIDMLSPLTRRECFLRHPFLESVFAEGEGIFIRIALTHSFAFSQTPVAVTRDTGENRGKAIRVNVEMHEKTLLALENDPAYRPEIYDPMLRSYRSRLYRDSGFSLARIGAEDDWARHALMKSVRLNPREAFHYRTAVGLGLLTLNPKIRGKVNALAHRLRGLKENATHVSGYGGASSNH